MDLNFTNNNSLQRRSLVIGGAGFIGSNLVDCLVKRGHDVTVIDNLSLGSRTNIESQRINFIKYNINGYQELIDRLSCSRFDEVWHLAANSDIRAGTDDEDIDFVNTFMTTKSVLSLMKKIECDVLHFASSSAIYGYHQKPLKEDSGPLLPLSNYGAMKLASEAMISAASEHFLKKACVYRFPNVVGVPATHGVIFDFINRLLINSDELEVLGNGTQQKTYLHVSDLLEAMLFVDSQTENGMQLYNIGPLDDGVTVKHIAEQTVSKVSPSAKINFGTEDRGWLGDVPKFEYSVEKLRQLGWVPKLSSEQAIEKAVIEIFNELLNK